MITYIDNKYVVLKRPTMERVYPVYASLSCILIENENTRRREISVDFVEFKQGDIAKLIATITKEITVRELRELINRTNCRFVGDPLLAHRVNNLDADFIFYPFATAYLVEDKQILLLDQVNYISTYWRNLDE